jgi:nucleoside-diphosphate-sugar epimerase
MYDPTHEYSQNVLVTGATGMIGSAVCRELTLNGYRVHGLVRDDVARARLPYAVIAVAGDIRKPEAWENAIKKVDAVVHLALPANWSGKMDAAEARRQGTEMAEALAALGEVCRRNKKKMIQTFSQYLYEPNAEGWVRESSPITSGRGFGLRHQIVWPVFQELRKRGLKAISVNPVWVYGPGGWFESGMLDPMRRGQSSYLGDGTQVMHFVESSDAAAAYRLAIEHGLVGEDYLIADDKPTTLGDFTRLVAREMGAPAPVSIPEEEAIEMVGAWAYEAYTLPAKADSTKAREQLGWTPMYRSPADGMPSVVREFKRRAAQPAVDYEAEARQRFRRPAPL